MIELSFPGLGLEFHFNRVAFRVLGWPIHWYAIIITTGLLLAVLYMSRRAPEFGLNPDIVADFALVCTISGLVGARLYYVAFQWDYYSAHPGEIIAIWGGGIAIYGGIIGGVIGGLLLARRRKIPPLPVFDMAVGGLILAQGIGRWGNFVNAEAFGGNTTLPWGMTGPQIVDYLNYYKGTLAAQGTLVDPNMPVHPTFFYESIWCIIGFILIAAYTKKRRFDGELTLIYAAWYGAGRFVIEGLRTDSLMLGPVRVSQAVALICVTLSVLLWLKARRGGKLYNKSQGGII